MNRLALLLATGLSTLAIASATRAADLIIEEPVEVGVVDVSGSWDGVFIGGFVGYGSGTYDWGPEADISGWLLGVNVGANFTLTDGIVAGVVGDIAWTDIGGTLVGDVDGRIDWQGSVRGRLGFDGGAFLPYVTGGLAVAGSTISEAAPADTDTQTHIGWTVGAGVEFAVTEDVSVDLLYRYSDYGSEIYTINGSDEEIALTAHTVTVGLNWRF